MISNQSSQILALSLSYTRTWIADGSPRTVKGIGSNNDDEDIVPGAAAAFSTPPRLIAGYLCLCLCYFTSYPDANAVTRTPPTISRVLEAGPSIAWAASWWAGSWPVSRVLPPGSTPRALNGGGGGGGDVNSLVSIVVSDLVSLRDRRKYQGLISGAIGTGGAVGPFIAAGFVRTGPEGEKLLKVDWLGVGASVTGIVLLLGSLHDFAWQGTQASPASSREPITSRLTRYIPVLRFGFALWTLGSGLKALFSLDTPIAVYAVALAIEGAGVGSVHQPGLVALQAFSWSEDRAVAASTRNPMGSSVAWPALRDALLPALFARVMDSS
ncbi:hypothetical protein DL769_008418 [Monosporascus sp. CRB-8-3]|nr:hypothetical protein DL769_008418 [Monosporascus sp. CRB-8-3]